MFMPGVWILWSKKKYFCYHFSKRKWKYFYTFNHFYSEKSSKKSKIAQIYYYDPQSAGINLQLTPKWFNSLDTNSKLESTFFPALMDLFKRSMSFSQSGSFSEFLSGFEWLLNMEFNFWLNFSLFLVSKKTTSFMVRKTIILTKISRYRSWNSKWGRVKQTYIWSSSIIFFRLSKVLVKKNSC